MIFITFVLLSLSISLIFLGICLTVSYWMSINLTFVLGFVLTIVSIIGLCCICYYLYARTKPSFLMRKKQKRHIIIQQNYTYRSGKDKYKEREKIYEYNGLAKIIKYDNWTLLFEDENEMVHSFDIADVNVFID